MSTYRRLVWLIMLALVLDSYRASAQTQTCYAWRVASGPQAGCTGTQGQTAQSVAQSCGVTYNDGYQQDTINFTGPDSALCPGGGGPPTSAGQTCQVDGTAQVPALPPGCDLTGLTGPPYCAVPPQTQNAGANLVAVSIPCSSCSTSGPNLDLLAAVSQSTGPGAGGTSGYNNLCVGGCTYANANNMTLIGGSAVLEGKAVPTGSPCGASGAPTASPASCAITSGATACVNDSTNTVSINGDTVPSVSTATSGQCTSYASGGVACVVPSGTGGASSSGGAATLTAPPAPTDPTTGQVATPVAQVMTAAGTVAYFSAAQVGKSTTPVATTAAGTGAFSGSGSSGGGGGVGSGSSGGDSLSGGGDCNTPPVCTGDAIQCGIVQQEWLDRCQGASEADIAAGIGDVGPASSVTQDVSTALSETGVVQGGGTSCPAPIAITVLGQTMSLDVYSTACTTMGWLSYAIMLCAYLVAARILFKGVAGN